MLRLYSGTDDSIVFNGGSASTQLYTCYINCSPNPSSSRLIYFTAFSYLSLFSTSATNLSYGSSSLKCGSGITGWTVTRYAQFTGLWETGSANSSGTIVWNTKPTRKAPCMYRVTNVFIDGVLNTKSFTMVWTNGTLNFYSEDGEINISLSTSRYYTSLPSISYCEISENKGSYVAGLYPLEAGVSDIGAINQVFNSAYINYIYGKLAGDVTGNVQGNLTGDVTGNLTGNVNSAGTSNVVYGAVFN